MKYSLHEMFTDFRLQVSSIQEISTDCVLFLYISIINPFA